MTNTNEMHSIDENGIELHQIEVDDKAYTVTFHTDLRTMPHTGLEEMKLEVNDLKNGTPLYSGKLPVKAHQGRSSIEDILNKEYGLSNDHITRLTRSPKLLS
jgi:hypothetical protein